ncbi:MAG: YceI family protein [Crocinitomicaceae bacterium]
MKRTTLFTLGLSILLLTACGSGNDEATADEATNADEQTSEASCMYRYNEGTSKLTWTGYKTSAKKGVPGSFNEITVSSEQNEDPKKVIESINFSIKTSSVETNDESRNQKISTLFFDVMNTPFIEGKIKELKEDGKAVFEIMMNDITLDVEGDYKLDGAIFKWSTDIDVSSWNGLMAVESLNEACKDLHTGEDGVSKTWSEVNLSLEVELLSDCD